MNFKINNYTEGQVRHDADSNSKCVGLLCFNNGNFLSVRTQLCFSLGLYT